MPKTGGTRLGGFPIWVWAVAGFGAIAAGLLLLPKSSGSSSSSTGANGQPVSSLESTPLIYVMVAPGQPVQTSATPPADGDTDPGGARNWFPPPIKPPHYVGPPVTP